MTNLDAPTSIFNLDNRGDNASLEIARKTYNQVLSTLSWERSWSSYQPTIQTSNNRLGNSRAVEAVRVTNGLESLSQNANYDIFYTTDSYQGNTDPNSYLPTTLWFYDGVKENIDVTSYLPKNDPKQQVIDIIGVRSDNYLYFTRETTSSSISDPNYYQTGPHPLELWRTNGTRSGTQLIKSWDKILGGVKDNLAQIEASINGDRVYLVFPKGRSETPGYEIWESQGTAETTVRLDKLTELVQKSLPGLGKRDPKQYVTIGPGTQDFLSPPKLSIQGYRGNEIYFTLESNLIRFRQPGYNFYEVWKLDQPSGELTRIVDLEYFVPNQPEDFLKPYLPNDLVKSVQGNYSVYTSVQSREFSSVYFPGLYYFPEGSAALKYRSYSAPDTTLVDFSRYETSTFSTLWSGGDLALPYLSTSTSIPFNEGGITRLYFTRANSVNRNHEIWVVDASGEGLQQVFSTKPGQFITGIYKMSPDVLLLTTNEGTQSLRLSARQDPIAQLVNGDYRALTQLAYEIGGQALAKEVVLPDFDTSQFNILGIKDFDGDGDVDLVFRHKDGGALIFWQMKGLQYETGFAAPAFDYTGWTPNLFYDFDRDSDLDIIWQHNSGTIAYWQMKGMQYETGGVIDRRIDTKEWFIQGVGDFDGNQKTDIFWRSVDGRFGLWELNQFSLEKAVLFPNSVGPFAPSNPIDGWTVQDLIDFDGDGDTDILWSYRGGEQMAIWEVQNGAILNRTLLPSAQLSFPNEQPTPKYRRTRYGGQINLDRNGTIEIWLHSGNTGRREVWKFAKVDQVLQYEASLTSTGDQYVIGRETAPKS